MKKIIYLIFIIFFWQVGFSFDHFENFCVCYNTQDCLHAIQSCNVVHLGKNIDHLEIIDKNIKLDCKGHKINSLTLENSGGSIENCFFENSFECLNIKYEKNISLKIKNNTFSHCYNAIIIKSKKYGNISITNNIFSKNRYGLVLYSPINQIKNNTFKSLNQNILIPPCKNNKTECNAFKKINVEGNYFAIYKNGTFVLESLNNNILKDKNPKKIDPTEQNKNKTTNNKINKENTNSFQYILIAIFVILIIIGIIVYLKYKKRNEDEFEW